jgi:hypothetical protein
MADDRSSNVDFEDCTQCVPDRVGICSNCEADGQYCEECHSTGNCAYCAGTGRRPIEVDPAYLKEVEAHGPLIAPEDPDAAA